MFRVFLSGSVQIRYRGSSGGLVPDDILLYDDDQRLAHYDFWSRPMCGPGDRIYLFCPRHAVRDDQGLFSIFYLFFPPPSSPSSSS